MDVIMSRKRQTYIKILTQEESSSRKKFHPKLSTELDFLEFSSSAIPSCFPIVSKQLTVTNFLSSPSV